MKDIKSPQRSRAFRALLRLLPRDFRESYGDEMEAVFTEQREEVVRGGRKEIAILWLRTLLGLAATAPREHLDALRHDTSYAGRLMRRDLGYTLSSVLTLAVGIGAFTGLWAISEGVLLRPLPYGAPDRLVRIWDTNLEGGIEKIGVTTGNVVDWRRRTRALDGVAGFYVMGRTLRGENEAEVVVTAQVTADFFPVLGVNPLLGRVFTEEESNGAWFDSAAQFVGSDPVAILSERLWRTRFGANREVIGARIDLETRPFRILGVMPASFRMPGPEVDLWIPWGFEDRQGGSPPRDQHYVSAVARLKPDVDLKQAEADLASVAAELARTYPETNRGWSVRLVPLQEDLLGSARLVLIVLTTAVVFLFLIATINVAGLELVRAMGRIREAALRSSLGASAGRLARQRFAESFLLSGASAALGHALAWTALRLVKAAGTGGIPRLDEVELGPSAIGSTLALAVVAGLVLAVSQTLVLGRVDAVQSLRGGVRGNRGSDEQRLRSGLVVAQVATAVVLLLGAGLLLRSFARLVSVNPGFHPKNVLVLPIFLDKNQYGSGAKVRAYYAELTERLSSIPGVVSVGGATALPTSPLGPDFERPVWAATDHPEPIAKPQADVRMVTPDYFRTLGIAIRRGRSFTPGDSPDSPRVVIVNEKLAREVWPGTDPVGQRLTIDYSTAGTYEYEVVGVAGDVRFRGLRSEPRSEIYLAHAQRSYLIMNVAVRTSGDPARYIPSVREALREVDPGQPAASVTPLEELVAATIARDRFAMLLLTIFASGAVFLALLGLSGLMAYRVRQRTHEIGVRMALGARRFDVLRAVLGQGARVSALGLLLGLFLALPASRLVEGLLFGVDPHDPTTYLLVVCGLAFVSLAACWFPARRAVGVDPVVALRCE